MRRVVSTAALVMCASIAATAATLTSETLAAWADHIGATEARIEGELASPRRAVPRALEGRTIHVPSGMIQQWRGAIFLPDVALDALLVELQDPPEQGPHQEDVVALRVMRRRPNGLDLFIRMTRRKLVSVTYDTEHRVTFRRHGPLRASSRSVATRITEVDASGDRGFLWRLNAYWRYEQIVGGVIVELESLTLSRDVPFGLGSIVEPIVDRVARDSVNRTLEHLRRTYGADPSR
jgi:hypothetical protein